MPPSVPSRLWNHSRVCLIARSFRDHVIDHLRNDDPLRWHDLLHGNAITNGNDYAAFAELLPGRLDESVNRQGLIQEIGQDGFPATHAHPALSGPRQESSTSG